MRANARRFRAPGAIPTVDFLLHHLVALVKKVAVKSHDACAVISMRGVAVSTLRLVAPYGGGGTGTSCTRIAMATEV
ncbi:MAG: hypothetical protein JWO48_2708 [Bryobacterales bacterium]|nr:hypothetical protein [Bryobacterales bacterium]